MSGKSGRRARERDHARFKERLKKTTPPGRVGDHPGAPTVRAGWQSYAEQILPADAPDVQRIETKRAFYAGAVHIMSINWGIGDDSVTEVAGVATLEAISQELLEFGELIKKGYA